MDENRLSEEQAPEQFSLCVRVREQLPDMLEGYLDAMTADAIRAHLSVCYLCARVYDEMERTIKLVETLPFAEPVRDFAPRIMAAIQAQPGYCFQAPVVEMEIQGKGMISEPRTTTGHQRPLRCGLGRVLTGALDLVARYGGPPGLRVWPVMPCAGWAH